MGEGGFPPSLLGDCLGDFLGEALGDFPGDRLGDRFGDLCRFRREGGVGVREVLRVLDELPEPPPEEVAFLRRLDEEFVLARGREVGEGAAWLRLPMCVVLIHDDMALRFLS